MIKKSDMKVYNCNCGKMIVVIAKKKTTITCPKCFIKLTTN